MRSVWNKSAYKSAYLEIKGIYEISKLQVLTIIIRWSIAVSTLSFDLLQYAAQSSSHPWLPHFSMTLGRQLFFGWKVQTIMNCKLQQLLQQKDKLKYLLHEGMCCVLQTSGNKYLSGDEDLLQQSVVILLAGIQLSLLLRLGTQFPVLDHLWIEVTIWVEIIVFN